MSKSKFLIQFNHHAWLCKRQLIGINPTIYFVVFYTKDSNREAPLTETCHKLNGKENSTECNDLFPDESISTARCKQKTWEDVYNEVAKLEEEDKRRGTYQPVPKYTSVKLMVLLGLLVLMTFNVLSMLCEDCEIDRSVHGIRVTEYGLR